MTLRKWLVVLSLLPLMTGCDFFQERLLHKTPKEVVVAECYGKYLYESDLNGIVPVGATVVDSLQRVNFFIDSWIERQVLLHQAEMNLSKEQLDLKKQLEDYRTTLVVYAYESQLINQKLDTVVDEDDIIDYYEQHKEDFQLHNTMVRVAYLILKEDCKQLDNFLKLMSNPDTLLIHELDILSSYYAEKSHLDVDSWMRLDELTNIVPMEILNPESFLKRNRFVRLDSDEYVYLVRFEEYLLEESLSPLVLERDNIRSVILTQRKQQLIERMKKATYEKAKREHAFTKYVGNPVLDNTN